MASKRVVVTGMGVISPVGNSVETFWDSLKSGKVGIDTIKWEYNEQPPVSVAAQVRDFKPEEHGLVKNDIRRNDRFCQFALAAANDAMADSGLVAGENIEPSRLGVYVGTSLGSVGTFTKETDNWLRNGADMVSPLFIPMYISNMASGNIAIRHHAEGPCIPIITACATGTHSVGEAFRNIQGGYADAIIAGGAEAGIHPLTLGGLNNCKALSRESDPTKACLPFDRNRSGFVMGEGAAVLVLEEYEHAKARGARMYAEIVGYGSSCDAYHCTSPKPDGEIAGRAIWESLEQAGYDNRKDRLYINAHGTGTHLNDSTETKAIKFALGKDASKARISSTKSMTGHMLGAAGSAELIASICALKDGIIPPTVGLKEREEECDLDYTPRKAAEADLTLAISDSLGFGGHNACVAVRKVK